MKRQLEIDYSFGYIFDKSKLIVMYPVGSNIMDEEEYEMEVEVAFLEDGIEAAFQENDIKEANITMKPLEMFLMKPGKVIPFVTAIKDANTKEEIPKLIREFDEEYEIKEDYLKKGYEIKDVYYVFENVVKYIPEENIDTLNILKVESNKFDFEGLIKATQENLDDVMDKNAVIKDMKKSELTNRLYVKSDAKESNARYVVFATKDSSFIDDIICADKEAIKDIGCDIGDLEINNTMDCGYIIEEKDGYITAKIANFNSETSNKNQIAQILDYSGVLKTKMINFINIFTK
ncbi:hypothetical protein CHL78_010385 [Romboutsia weinsteinii]|uniref:Uncharacterized protein n=1 Tax=Romboutsia weinsteinii TaxID=2020949 RepID=A0A371J3D5_9FIRM|nr:hypothetical protein [Romboutsia weinsteinii]RDY27194.1 hypothetical protein CHL78_010385 [Romboutsia weinsteinii]